MSDDIEKRIAEIEALPVAKSEDSVKWLIAELRKAKEAAAQAVVDKLLSQGRSKGAVAVERSKIVAWLRTLTTGAVFADAIARGEHEGTK